MAEQHIAVRQDSGQVAFYINGSLQFDSRDERVYHEYLVRPALGLASARCPGPLHALILGGGDGLAAREILTAESAERVDLVDFDAEVLRFAREEFSALNGGALSDERVALHCRDAADFLVSCRHRYDLIVVDLTFPEDLASCRLFTEGFYRAVKDCLSPVGVVALNAVSPTVSPAAYWSIHRTLKAAGLGPRPYQASIPSFLSHGYGEWGFFMGSPRPILSRELRCLRFEGAGLPSRSAFLRSMVFPSTHILFGQGCARSIVEPADLLWLLNLRLPALPAQGDMLDFSRRDPLSRLGLNGKAEQALLALALSDWANYIFVSLRSLDWDELFKEMDRRIKGVPAGLREEVERLRDGGAEAFREQLLSREGIQRALTALVVVMIIINLVYPDNAYAKGYHGGHHHGYHSSSAAAGVAMQLTAPVPPAPFRKLPTGQAGRVVATDMSGKIYPSQQFVFLNQSEEPVTEQATYRLADDLFLSPSGNAYYTIPGAPFHYMLNAEEGVLFKTGDPVPLMSFALDSQLVNLVKENLEAQKKLLDKTLRDYSRWMGWVEPLALVSSGIMEEAKEIQRLRGLQRIFKQLNEVYGNYLPPLEDAGSSLRLAPGVYLSSQGSILLRAGFGRWSSLQFRSFNADAKLPRVKPNKGLEEFVEAVVRWNLKRLPTDSLLRHRLLKGLGEEAL